MRGPTCECGSRDFIVNEGLSHKAVVDDETGVLEVYKVYANEIEGVICSDCWQEIDIADVTVEWCI